MMEHCKTCVHWCGNGPFGNLGGVLPEQAICKKSQDQAEVEHENPKTRTPDAAYSLMDDGWYGIWVGPEFGCVHHTPAQKGK